MTMPPSAVFFRTTTFPSLYSSFSSSFFESLSFKGLGRGFPELPIARPNSHIAFRLPLWLGHQPRTFGTPCPLASIFTRVRISFVSSFAASRRFSNSDIREDKDSTILFKMETSSSAFLVFSHLKNSSFFCPG